MTFEQRLNKAIELTEMGRSAFKSGLRELHPDLSDDELHRLYVQELIRCHKQRS